MKSVIKSPQECSVSELNVFETLTKEGGEVSAIGLRGRVEQAHKLIFIYADNDCVAVGGLKNPIANYKTKVFKKAGVPELESNYKYEVGYLYSKVKGVGNLLMQSICEASSGNQLFATTRENNEVMHHLFGKYHFSRLGEPYDSENGDYSLGVFGTKS